jgi:hypothetical protein
VVLWWGLCLAVGVVAEERDRGLLTWFALAFVLSPLAAAIIIALLPKRLAELRHLELLAALARGQ